MKRKGYIAYKGSNSKGEFKPFTGELKDQDGKVHNKPDEELDPDEIIEMDWLLDNVVGRVPEYEELDDNSKCLLSIREL